jgi:tetratricopeptide (TPR) repeat protein
MPSQAHPFRLATIALAAMLAQQLPACAEENNADNTPAAQCRQAIRQADALVGQGKNKLAVEAYRSAADTFPDCSLPHSHAASLFYDLSKNAEPEQAATLRQNARDKANRALQTTPGDLLAHQVLRKLDFGEPQQRPIPAGPASQEFSMAEGLYGQERYDEAIEHYRKAIAIDPKFALAYVYLGDCYFSRKQYAEAAALYRQATQLDPLNGQAWRFLANALLDEGKVEEVEDLLCQSIGAAPNDLYVWFYLQSYLDSMGVTLEPIDLRIHAYREAGEKTWTVDEQNEPAETAQNKEQPGATLIWSANAMAHIEQARLHPEYSPFQLDFAAWQRTFEFAARSAKDGELKTVDPGLNHLYALNQAGLLKPALLLLAYREDYRPELESWKKENPKGIRDFVHQSGMRP